MPHKLFSASIAATCLSALIAIPGMAQAGIRPALIAQQTVAAPQIDSFQVDPVEQLAPGTELVFTLQGTPNSTATFTVGNIARNVSMREVEPGVYEGRYTIRRSDQITENTVIRGNLKRGDRIASKRLQQSLIANTTEGSNQSGSNSAQTLSIDRFTLEPASQLEPGTELNFTLVGTPKAKATFSIDGVTNNQPMREVSSGTYQGQYVIRRQDSFPASGAKATASLQMGDQVVRAQLNQELASGTSTTKLPLEIISPTNNSKVSGTIEVRGRSAPNATVDVKVQAKTSVVGLVGFNQSLLDRTVTADNQGNFSFTFKPTVAVSGTRYDVSLNASQGTQTSEETLVLYQK